VEKRARYVVLAAKGTVAESAELISCGTLKQMSASATVYWLYAPSPGISPEIEEKS
jgi:hypothetical protein